MRSLRIVGTIVLLFASSTVFAQSDAKNTFERLQSLNGTWEGKTREGAPLKVTFRTVSGGSAVLSEIMGEENMVTMFHIDNDRVLATHYCAAGNQPRMQASLSADGKTITFSFVDATNLATPKAGHMDHLVITIPDAGHHSEEWTFVQDGKRTTERFEMARAKASM
ncbi:MAG TPA: hypothetical protein VK466_17925 [Terriglobales bacterium]|nr:hypothetical protein [Terriglobales bacterium]